VPGAFLNTFQWPYEAGTVTVSISHEITQLVTIKPVSNHVTLELILSTTHYPGVQILQSVEDK
jgi:hypothetical protein